MSRGHLFAPTLPSWPRTTEPHQEISPLLSACSAQAYASPSHRHRAPLRTQTSPPPASECRRPSRRRDRRQYTRQRFSTSPTYHPQQLDPRRPQVSQPAPRRLMSSLHSTGGSIDLIHVWIPVQRSVHHGDQGERHHHPDEQRRNKPHRACAHGPRYDSAEKAQQRQRRLHPGGALVARCPVQGSHAGVEPPPRRVLREIDVECRSGKERGGQGGDEFKCLKHQIRFPWGPAKFHRTI